MKTNLKIGDKVRVIKASFCHSNHCRGRIGEIIHIRKLVGIKFINTISCCVDQTCIFYPRSLELLNERKKK